MRKGRSLSAGQTVVVVRKFSILLSFADPMAGLIQFVIGERAYVTGHGPGDSLDHRDNPADIGNDRDSLKVGQVMKSDFSVIPECGRRKLFEFGAELIEKSDFLVRLKSFFYRGHQDSLIIVAGDLAARDNGDNIRRHVL